MHRRGSFDVHGAWLRLLPLVLVSLLAGTLLGTTPADAVPVARTALYFEGESGAYLLGASSLSFTSVTATAAGADTIEVHVDQGGHSWNLWIAKSVGSGAWTTGAYENAERTSFRSAGHPGLDLFGDGRGCNTVAGRFVVDDVALDGTGTLLRFSARFEIHCEGLDPAVFGAVTYNSTSPYRSHAIPFGPLPSSQAIGTTGPSQPVTVTNNGPDTLSVTSAGLTGTDAAAFQITGDACSGHTLAVSASCTISVAFSPTGSPGARSAKLTVFDDLTPSGGTGRDVVLQGNATAPIDSHGELTPLTPTRVLDTRDGTGTTGTSPLLGGQTIDATVTGLAGIATSGVSAVVANVTAVSPTAASHLSVYPTGTSRPEISNLNFVAGQTVPNLVTVQVGTGGKITIFNNSGAVHVLVDVVGYYSSATGPAGGRFHPVSPKRILDRRDGTGGTGTGKVGPQQTVRLTVAGAGGIPASGVRAVVLNVTVTGPTAASHLTVFPDDVSRPVASNLNFVAGQTVPNLVVVGVPANGIVDLYNQSGSTYVIADVMGYYDTNRATEVGRFVPLTPARMADTRSLGQPLGPQDAIALHPGGYFGVPPYPGFHALALNVTAITPTAAGWLAAFPLDATGVDISNLNFAAGQTVPNFVMSGVSATTAYNIGPGAMAIFNITGQTHVAIDAFGYFT